MIFLQLGISASTLIVLVVFIFKSGRWTQKIESDIGHLQTGYIDLKHRVRSLEIDNKKILGE
jgi:hypothetical protein